MKLRNKKTGEIIEDAQYRIYSTADGFEINTPTGEYFYRSLKELFKDWEDYEPKEPLIKDKGIRKAVRAWAKVNEIDRCVCKDELHCIVFETERGMFISFENADYIPPEGSFTITELCGEEE